MASTVKNGIACLRKVDRLRRRTKRTMLLITTYYYTRAEPLYCSLHSIPPKRTFADTNTEWTPSLEGYGCLTGPTNYGPREDERVKEIKTKSVRKTRKLSFLWWDKNLMYQNNVRSIKTLFEFLKAQDVYKIA